MSDLCRKCDGPLPPPPRLDLNPATDGPDGENHSGRLCGEHNGLHSRTKTARELTIGRKLRDLRDQRHLTQQEMASKAGVPRTYISRIENARLLPGPVMLHRIADALQVEILDLLPPGKNGSVNGGSIAGPDAFWNSLAGYFVQLPAEEMVAVLHRVRSMAGAHSPHSFISEAAMAAR